MEMGRLCSGRPEKSQGQRGEVMVAASGVISLPHSRGPLSDSAALCRCGGAGNTHLLISAGPFLPCPAPPRPGQGDGAQSPSRGCPASAGTAEGELCQRILNFLSQSPAAPWASPMGWHWSISALYPNQFAPAGGKLRRQLQTAWGAPNHPLSTVSSLC